MFQKKTLASSLNMTNFKEVCTVPTDFGVSFTKFKSEKTGLTVILADIEGKKTIVQRRRNMYNSTCHFPFSSSCQRLFCFGNRK